MSQRFLFLSLLVIFACVARLAGAEPAGQPNILWITSEDHGPHLGCYGDRYATTPHLDGLAARGMLYTRCWSNAPVCAPARTTLISGMYPTSTGSEHMRSMVPYPQGKRMYPQLLREAGYYCTNNSKEDFNLRQPGRVWDESSGRAHWRNRAEGQPFFAIFNSTKSHESRLRVRPHAQLHDPDHVRVPAYHPDTPEVRQDWAQYYDTVAEADADAGRVLQQLEQDGLSDDTIVFFYADHGSGMPRSKRWPYNSGLHVPLIVHFPSRFQHLAPPDYQAGGKSERLVSFVDFAPTVLSLAGIAPPPWMQGNAFLGPYRSPPVPFLHGFRGRMDERVDLVRSVTDGRYVYIRNYMPHKIYGQHINYMFQTPTTQVWKRRFDEGQLTPEQSAFWSRKPPEELYELENDPDEVRNLADSTQHAATLHQLREAQRDHALKIRDVGFLPEGELHARSADSTPYDMAREAGKYPLRRLLDVAQAASMLQSNGLPELEKAFDDPDSAVRYWGALGILMRGQSAVASYRNPLRTLLADSSPYVRIVAAEALARFGEPADVQPAVSVLLELAPPDTQTVFVCMAALGAIDGLLGERLPDQAAERKPQLEALLERVVSDRIGFADKNDNAQGRFGSYVPRLLESIRAER